MDPRVKPAGDRFGRDGPDEPETLRYACALRFCRLPTRSSTTPGSASVEVSPRLPYSSSAILRRMRRMILPERVFGRLGANWMRSGEAIGPIALRTQAINSLR